MKSARLYAAGLGKPLLRLLLSISLDSLCAGCYEAFLNGQRVGDGLLGAALTTYSSRVLYNTFDVTSMLSAGAANAIGVALGNCWFNPLPLRFWGSINLRDSLTIGQVCGCSALLSPFHPYSCWFCAAPGDCAADGALCGRQQRQRHHQRHQLACRQRFAFLSALTFALPC